VELCHGAQDEEEGAGGGGDDAGDLRHRGDGGVGGGGVGGQPHGQHGVRGGTQRGGTQPQRAGGAGEPKVLRGLVDSSGGELLQQVQLQLLLAGTDLEGGGRCGADTGHVDKVSGSCVDAT